MSIGLPVTRWRNVGRFCIDRAGDYGALIGVELEETPKRLVIEVGALVTLAVAALFTVSFVCIAIIATAWGTPYFLWVVWGAAAMWLLVSIVSLIVVSSRNPVARSEFFTVNSAATSIPLRKS
nr:hypothetical protein HUO10_000053 [Paraburkholderia busanensis]